jgi:5-methylcytosine-specific restriction endonuclease McrA
VNGSSVIGPRKRTAAGSEISSVTHLQTPLTKRLTSISPQVYPGYEYGTRNPASPSANNSATVCVLLGIRERNPTYNRDYNREWGRANPDKIREKDNKRRAFKQGKPGSFTAQEWAELKRRYNYTCLRCGRREPEIKLTADHITPISKGGAGTIDNIQPLCKPCNSTKHGDTIDYRPYWG